MADPGAELVVALGGEVEGAGPKPATSARHSCSRGRVGGRARIEGGEEPDGVAEEGGFGEGGAAGLLACHGMAGEETGSACPAREEGAGFLGDLELGAAHVGEEVGVAVDAIVEDGGEELHPVEDGEDGRGEEDDVGGAGEVEGIGTAAGEELDGAGGLGGLELAALASKPAISPVKPLARRARPVEAPMRPVPRMRMRLIIVRLPDLQWNRALPRLWQAVVGFLGSSDPSHSDRCACHLPEEGSIASSGLPPFRIGDLRRGYERISDYDKTRASLSSPMTNVSANLLACPSIKKFVVIIFMQCHGVLR